MIPSTTNIYKCQFVLLIPLPPLQNNVGRKLKLENLSFRNKNQQNDSGSTNRRACLLAVYLHYLSRRAYIDVKFKSVMLSHK